MARRFTPGTVVTTAPFERHPTHRATTRATVEALRRLPAHARPTLLGYPVWGPILGSEGVRNVEIGPVLERKLRAIRCHESQLLAREFDEAALCRNRLDALLDGVTGAAPSRSVERYVDLSPLLDPQGPNLEEWLRGRLGTLLEELLD
jgi:LmbE family N-acetylglucosaminyl deacetylase